MKERLTRIGIKVFLLSWLGGAALAHAQVDSLVVDDTGYVGVGTATPAAQLHVFQTDGTAQIRVEEDSVTIINRELFRLENNGAPQFALQNTASGTTWDFNALGPNFNITRQGTGVQEFSLNGNNGNLPSRGS